MDARRSFVEPSLSTPGQRLAKLALIPMLALSLFAGRAAAGSWLFGSNAADLALWALLPAVFCCLSLGLALRSRGPQRAFALLGIVGCVLAFGGAALSAPSLYPVG